MTNEDLKLKVINAQAKVEKKAAILWKHRQQLDKLITKGADDYAIRSKHRDIGEASEKLSEAQASLANWKEKYAEKIRQDDYLEANAPEILVKFLDDWKQRAITYYLRRYDSFIEFREELKQKERDARLEALRTLPELERARELFKDREITDYDLANLFPRRPVEAFLQDRGLEYHQIKAALSEKSDTTISRTRLRRERHRAGTRRGDAHGLLIHSGANGQRRREVGADTASQSPRRPAGRPQKRAGSKSCRKLLQAWRSK